MQKVADAADISDISGEPVKVRPVCGAVEAPCGQLSNTLAELVNTITKFEDKHESECRSSEAVRAEVKKVNLKLILKN